VTLRSIEAIYEGGVLRPVEPLELPESEHVIVTITTSDKVHATRDWAVMEMARAETANLKNIPSIEDVRAALSAIPGSLSADLIADRGEY
jgi:predicted DNA-binding antitoxin AbrB/MazE fold protein